MYIIEYSYYSYSGSYYQASKVRPLYINVFINREYDAHVLFTLLPQSSSCYWSLVVPRCQDWLNHLDIYITSTRAR